MPTRILLTNFSELPIDEILEHFDPEDSREDIQTQNYILAQSMQFREWGVSGNRVVLKLELARVLLEVVDARSWAPVVVTFVPHEVWSDSNPDRFGHVFRMLPEELKHLKDRILSSKHKRTHFDELFHGNPKRALPVMDQSVEFWRLYLQCGIARDRKIAEKIAGRVHKLEGHSMHRVDGKSPSWGVGF
jgi:hypothetical protein